MSVIGSITLDILPDNKVVLHYTVNNVQSKPIMIHVDLIEQEPDYLINVIGLRATQFGELYFVANHKYISLDDGTESETIPMSRFNEINSRHFKKSVFNSIKDVCDWPEWLPDYNGYIQNIKLSSRLNVSYDEDAVLFPYLFYSSNKYGLTVAEQYANKYLFGEITKDEFNTYQVISDSNEKTILEYIKNLNCDNKAELYVIYAFIKGFKKNIGNIIEYNTDVNYIGIFLSYIFIRFIFENMISNKDKVCGFSCCEYYVKEMAKINKKISFDGFSLLSDEVNKISSMKMDKINMLREIKRGVLKAYKKIITDMVKQHTMNVTFANTENMWFVGFVPLSPDYANLYWYVAMRLN